jgi:hypothetical protein
MDEVAECKIHTCGEQARWIITIDGHPNVPDQFAHGYCTKHADRVPFWDESPVPYTTTVRGPFAPAALRAELARR